VSDRAREAALASKSRRIKEVSETRPATVEETKPKQKKKKQSAYMQMMQGIKKGTERDYVAERERLKDNLGGGEFSKIDKI
jgi:hypothetical protein